MPRNITGNVINIIDQRVLNLTPFFTTYTFTKAGLWTLTKTLAMALAPRIRVNAIGPTYTKTRLVKSLNEDPEKLKFIIERTPLRRLAEVSEMAGGILFLASNASSMVTGHTLMIDGGWASN